MILQTPFKRPSNAMHTQRPLECRRPSNAQFHTLAFKRPTYAKPFRVQTPFKRLSTHPPITPWRVNAPLGRSRLTRPSASACPSFHRRASLHPSQLLWDGGIFINEKYGGPALGRGRIMALTSMEEARLLLMLLLEVDQRTRFIGECCRVEDLDAGVVVAGERRFGTRTACR
jgi:hypothetical protein